jgi:hypothetical protein
MPTVQFSKNIRKRGRQVVNSSSNLTRRMAVKTLKSLVHSTKVDTGLARSNWRVGLGNPTSAVIEPYFKYPKHSKAQGQGIGETANARATIDAGRARINSVRGVSGVGLKTAIYISNNVPYIDKAMNGGAVEVAVLEARNELRSFRVFDPRNDREEEA